jgi:hypothetical protein
MWGEHVLYNTNNNVLILALASSTRAHLWFSGTFCMHHIYCFTTDVLVVGWHFT